MKLWTESEDAILQQAYPSVGPLVFEILGRTRRAAIGRAARLGITRPHAGTATNLSCAWCSALAVTAVRDKGGFEPACAACSRGERPVRRNVWMVDRCHSLMALWNETDGGTGNCVKYAKAMQKPIVNVWQRWLRYP